MNRKFWTLLTTLAFSALAAAQTDEPIFKSKTELVLVPVVVTRHGELVHGLTAKDFALKHDGISEKIVVFEEIDAVPAKVDQVPLPAHTVQNYAPANTHQDVVIFMLDFLNGSWSSNALMRSYFAEMLRGFAETRTPVTVLLFTSKGLVQVHSFTSSPENLTKAVEQLSAKVPLDAQHALSDIPRWSSALAATDSSDTTAALQQFAVRSEMLNSANLDRATMAADAVEQIAHAFGGIPGRKKLIWFSTGFLVGETRLRNTALDAVSTDIFADFKINDRRTRAWKALSDANIAVYPIDSNGGQNPSWNERFDMERGGDRLNKAAPPRSVPLGSDLPSLMDVANRTGGQMCTDLPNACIKRIQADAVHYYILGFYLHGDQKPGWHKLKVTVEQPDTSARTREGFVVGDADRFKSSTSPKTASSKDSKKDAERQTVKAALDKEIVITALASPLDYTSIPLQLRWSRLPSTDQAPKSQIEFVLTSPPGVITVDPVDSGMNLDYLAFVRPVGKVEGESFPSSLVATLSQAQQRSFAVSGFLYRKQLTLAPGRYEVRVFLRDNLSQKIGTVSTVIDLTSASAAKQ